MHVIIGSTNPVKINAARHGFSAMLGDGHTFTGVSVPSGVSDQPVTDKETRLGARNRARAAQEQYPGADFWIGIEGGIEDEGSGMHAFAWVCVLSRARSGEARTATFTLPPEVARLVRSGVELGHADDQVFGRTNSKHKDGAVGLLTDGLVDRTAYYQHAVCLALIPFKKKELYKE